MYALIKDNAIVKYPYSLFDLRKDNPNISFPRNPSDAALAEFGMLVVFNTPEPAVTATQVAEQGTPAFNSQNQRWEQTWTVRDKTQAEIDSYQQALQASITEATQQRLDDFAKTKGYDGILSACTYANSPTTIFATEGQYCVNQRDATWAKLYQILTEVQLGLRQMPTGYADIEAELPPLTWPE